MVFSSIPAYLDPSNWQQQQNFQTRSGVSNPQFPPEPHPPAPTPPPQPNAVGGQGSIRPGSMADRARMANIPVPETALKCPRCESTNTKFCYFNNYSLTQPRHFCKTCRRYWTRGGSLRNVPVGGGCRRNKRSKGSGSSRSKSPASSGDLQTASGSTTTTTTIPSSSGTSNILGLTSQYPQLRFMAPLGQLSDYGQVAQAQIGLNYSGISAPVVGVNDMNFHIGSNLLGGGGMDQWRWQQPPQFPFLGGLDQQQGLYPYQGGVEPSSYVGAKLSASMLSQLASVKMEDNQESILSRQLLGGQGNDQWSNTTAWTDLSGFSSSSTSNQL